MNYYPWHESFRERITQQFNDSKLAHAILFAGPEFLGKVDFATALGNQFLCTVAADSGACGACPSCLLIRAGTHADLRFVQPEDSKQIKIDQIRDLIGWVSQTSQRGGMKIAIVSPAEQMNHQSANALLKCLEEPAPNTLIFLVTARPGSLLPTIRSRCQAYHFSAPDREIALAWLERQTNPGPDPSLMLDISGGAPLAVLARFSDDYLGRRQQVITAVTQVLTGAGLPLESATLLQKYEMDEVLEIILGILSDSLKYKLNPSIKSLKNKDMETEISAVSRDCGTRFLFSAFDRANADLKVARSTSNPNKALLLESLMIDLADC